MPKRELSGRIHFNELDGDEPDVRIRVVDRLGRTQDVRRDEGGGFTLEPKLVGQDLQLEISDPDGRGARRFSYDTVAERFAKEGFLELAPGSWHRWIGQRYCVTGRATVCRSILGELTLPGVLQQVAMKADLLPSLAVSDLWWLEDHPFAAFPALQVCEPVCGGKVEVFVTTTCCKSVGPYWPPIIIQSLCEIIDCTRLRYPVYEIPDWPVGPFPPILDDPNPPDPIVRTQALRAESQHQCEDCGGGTATSGLPTAFAGPAARPSVEARYSATAVEAAITTAVRRAEKTSGGPSVSQVLEAGSHLQALLSLDVAGQIGYIQRVPSLWRYVCESSTERVAETVLEPDGRFDACFRLPFLRTGCHYRVSYVVSQFQDGAWVVVYDGPARHQSFTLGEEAHLRATSAAETCSEGPNIDPNSQPFATLELIGGTYAEHLQVTATQTGPHTFSALSAADGLLYPEHTFAPSPSTNWPWAQTLGIRYFFDPRLFTNVGARWYRTRVVRVDDSGAAATGAAAMSAVITHSITGDISWSRYVLVPGDVQVQWHSLLHPTNPELYEIPDPASHWRSQGVHAVIPTARLIGDPPTTRWMPNGRYAIVLEVFDAAGNQLKPDDAPAAEPGASTPFDFRRIANILPNGDWDTDPEPHSGLAHLVRVDNDRSDGDLINVRLAGAAGLGNCLYLSGPAGADVELQLTAKHDNGFLHSWGVQVYRGLSGYVTGIGGIENVTADWRSIGTVGSLLGPEPRCSFAVNLGVETKHHSGSGRITNYNSSDTIAFALQVT